jgi:glucose-6-phosphate isomerase
MIDVAFDPKLDVVPIDAPLDWRIGNCCFGPTPELRSLDSIRKSLRDPACSGPDPVYAICMDVGRHEHREELHRRMLLFGVVTYAAGRLGDEPVRSQGHVHAISRHSGWRPPELYEIWRGRAVIYMQERAEDDPGRCFAIEAGPGETVLVPPGWAHATISADPSTPLAFGAWCDREYGFEYDAVRSRGGLAWFPLLNSDGSLRWERNGRYAAKALEQRGPSSYARFGVEAGVPIYEQFARDPARMQFISKAGVAEALWRHFEP